METTVRRWLLILGGLALVWLVLFLARTVGQVRLLP